jgi:hypothetical protein
MKEFFYVYILASQANERSITLALHGILNPESVRGSNTIEARVRMLRNTGHGESKRPSRPNPRAKRANSKNI